MQEDKYLGIDFGSKRVGLSVSDFSKKIAFPLSVVLNSENLLDEIVEVCKKNNISLIVIGDSKDFSGKDNVIMDEVYKFKDALFQKLKIEIVLYPEFLTSFQASRVTGKNDMIDASASALILQSYLDKLNNN
jgi:putative Holliday junction resolvase